ncbi:UNKNOWN [Stylonychia lemnae]|uniref:Kinase n=1 Tax=Stylonychia lemnae TaxID=5949 RepID=A0A078AE65_STYLE|nr:UNKNOWN [Stylonychia lemnae]|eukprot:CDW79208.1 UNKNOWN [Stylonychia lemnae]
MGNILQKSKQNHRGSLQRKHTNSGKQLQILQEYLAGCSEDKSKIIFEEGHQTILKVCKQYEIDVYECIFNTDAFPPHIFDDTWRVYYKGLRKFVPHYFGYEPNPTIQDKFNVRLQNLLDIRKDLSKGLLIDNQPVQIKPVSYLDLKIGTKCVLKSLDSPDYEEFKYLDDSTTTITYGFRVTGYCIFENCQVKDYLCEDFSQTRTYDQVKQAFTKILTSQSGQIAPRILIERLILRIQELEQFLRQYSRAVILGSSLFFTFARDYYDEYELYDSQLKIVDVNLIDMCHMELMEKTEDKDWGFIKGLEETIKLLKDIISEKYDKTAEKQIQFKHGV